VWIRPQREAGGTQRFFSLSFRHLNLSAYYNNMFTLVHQYKYTLTELENMIPWERDLYIGLVNDWVKQEEQRLKVKKEAAEQNLRRALKTKGSR